MTIGTWLHSVGTVDGHASASQNPADTVKGASIFPYLTVKEYRVALVQFQTRCLGTWRSRHLLMVCLVYSWSQSKETPLQELARRQLGHVP